MSKSIENILDNSPFFRGKPEVQDYQKDNIIGKTDVSDDVVESEDIEKQDTEQQQQENYKFNEKDFKQFEIIDDDDDDNSEEQQKDTKANDYQDNSDFDDEPPFDKKQAVGITDILAPLLLPKIADLSFKLCRFKTREIEALLLMSNVEENIRKALIEYLDTINAANRSALEIPKEYIDALTDALKSYIEWKQIKEANPGTTLITVILVIAFHQVTAIIQIRTTNSHVLSHLANNYGIDEALLNPSILRKKAKKISSLKKVKK